MLEPLLTTIEFADVEEFVTFIVNVWLPGAVTTTTGLTVVSVSNGPVMLNTECKTFDPSTRISTYPVIDVVVVKTIRFNINSEKFPVKNDPVATVTGVFVLLIPPF